MVVSERGIGDGLTLIPALAELKKMHPEIDIELVAPGISPLQANFRGLCGFIYPDEIPSDSSISLRSWLDDREYTWVWNTQNDHQKWRDCLNSSDNPNWISAPPHKNWPKRPVIRLRMTHLQGLFPELESVSPPVIQLTQKQLDERDRFAKQFPQALIAIQPGGNDPNKVWSKEGFREVIKRMSNDRSRSVVLFLHGEEWSGAEMEDRDSPIITVRESLPIAVARLAACSVFIGNDSGFYHLAHALGLGVVGIYRTIGSRKIWSYDTHRSRALSFYLPPTLRKHWRRFITVDKVVKAALSVISYQ